MPRKPRGVRVTLYLPDDLRKQAADAGLNLSALLRRAVEAELRGDQAAPTVDVERAGETVEVRVSLPADELRKRLR